MADANLEEQLCAELRRAAEALDVMQADMRVFSAACSGFDWETVKAKSLSVSANMDVYLDCLASAHRKLEMARGP